MSRAFALLAAGGTGGHLYPAIAVAEALERHGVPRDSLHFVIDARPMSRAALDRCGFECTALAMRRGWERSAPHAPARRGARSQLASVLRNGRTLAATAFAGMKALRILWTRRPAVVIGFGAYVSLPVVVAARVLRMPVVVHEQNASPGLANRIASRLGATAAVALPDTALAGAVVTGNPVRPEILDVVRRPSAPPMIAFVGGSLGAGILNDVALDLYSEWRARSDVRIRHVCGSAHFARCRAELDRRRKTEDVLQYDLVEFEHDMAQIYRNATLLVARAGGMVAEIAAAGVPSILVPWSGATEQHQLANARLFADRGAALCMPEVGFDVAALKDAIAALLADPLRLEAMGKAAQLLARRDAADAVAELAQRHAQRHARRVP